MNFFHEVIFIVDSEEDLRIGIFGNLSRDHPFVQFWKFCYDTLINLLIYQKIQHEILNKNHEKNFQYFGHLKFQKLQFFFAIWKFSVFLSTNDFLS